MFNYNQQLKTEVESLKRANSLMRDNSTTDKTSYQEKISKLQAEIQQLKVSLSVFLICKKEHNTDKKY